MRLQALAAAALLATTAAAQAGISTITNAASFVAQTGAAADNFADLTINSALGTTSLARTVGAYGYSVQTETELYVVPVAGTVALSSGNYSDTLTLAVFTTPVRAIGGNFFATNILGELGSGAITLVATDVNGLSVTASLAGGSLSGFTGFVSDVDLASLRVSLTTPNTDRYVSMDNVSLSAVPEPQAWAMALLGLAALRGAARRRG